MEPAKEIDPRFVRRELVGPDDELNRRQVVNLALLDLAKKFVTSEEVNGLWIEAAAALRAAAPPSTQGAHEIGTPQSAEEEPSTKALKQENIADALTGLFDTLGDAGLPFVLRPFGIKDVDDRKVRDHLREFLRNALFPAARIITYMKEKGGTSPLEDHQGVPETDPEFAEAIEDAEPFEMNSIFKATPGSRSVVLGDLPAVGESTAARCEIDELLARAADQFQTLIEASELTASAATVQEFLNAIDTARLCLNAFERGYPPATFIVSDVHDGVVNAFRAVGIEVPDPDDGDKGLKAKGGGATAAQILTRIILELSGLVPSTLSRDDTSRADYTRKMRARARKKLPWLPDRTLANGVGQTPEV